MKLYTQIEPKELNKKLNFRHNYFLIGSCFSEYLSSHFDQACLSITDNPYGITYNPLIVAYHIDKIINASPPLESEVFLNNNLFCHFDYHGSFSKTDQLEAFDLMTQSHKNAVIQLKKADTLIITLGTAFVFEEKNNHQVVNNCHKLPNDRFKRKLLTIYQIQNALSGAFDKLISNNKDLQIILTVSPIRHLRDGLIANSRSKSQLIAACHNLKDKYPSVSYFPSYEILVDELRDYRFYKSDLIHPSDSAISFVIQKFIDFAFDDESKEFFKDTSKLTKAINHRPLHITPDYQRHLKDTQLNLIRILKKYDNYDLSRMTSEINQKLENYFN